MAPGFSIKVQWRSGSLKIDFHAKNTDKLSKISPEIKEAIRAALLDILSESEELVDAGEAEDVQKVRERAQQDDSENAQSDADEDSGGTFEELPNDPDGLIRVMTENLRFLPKGTSVPSGYSQADLSTAGRVSGFYFLCKPCLSRKYGANAHANLIRAMRGLHLSDDSDPKLIMRKIGEEWHSLLGSHQHEQNNPDRLFKSPGCEPLIEMLISDLVPAVKINPTILQNKSLVLDLDRIKETAQFRKARAANPGIVVALKDARYALFERAKARADESGSEVPVGDIRLLGGSFMRTDPPNLALNQLILTIRRVHQADGAFAVQHSARKAIPEAWSQTVESNSTWSAGFHDEVRENLTTHILPIITEIHGGILPSIPCGTQAARDLPPPPETYPSFFKFETKYIPPQEATGRWKGSLPTISEVIITAASQMRESAVSPMPGLLEALRHARSSDIDESLDCRTFNFNRLLYRFCKLQEFINIHQELLTTADGRVIERVMTIMTTVATTCPIVCHTSLIWAWAQYALEHVFMDSYAHETSSVARQKVAQVFEQLSLFLECIALYAVTGSTVGLSIENPITSKINVAKNKRFQCETQAYCCGFLECPEELLKEHDAASGREKHEHSISTCQYSARVGNRRLLEEMEGGWLGHLSYFPCLESLWLYAFIPAVASHALISAFQGHFVEKAARGKTTRWAMLALNV